MHKIPISQVTISRWCYNMLEDFERKEDTKNPSGVKVALPLEDSASFSVLNFKFVQLKLSKFCSRVSFYRHAFLYRLECNVLVLILFLLPHTFSTYFVSKTLTILLLKPVFSLMNLLLISSFTSNTRFMFLPFYYAWSLE